MIEKAHGTLKIENIDKDHYKHQGSIDRKTKALVSMKQRQIELIKEQFPSEAREKKVDESFDPGCSPPRYLNRVNKTEITVKAHHSSVISQHRENYQSQCVPLPTKVI